MGVILSGLLFLFTENLRHPREGLFNLRCAYPVVFQVSTKLVHDFFWRFCGF